MVCVGLAGCSLPPGAPPRGIPQYLRDLNPYLDIRANPTRMGRGGKEHHMLLTGRQLISLADFADGSDCRVGKLAGVNSPWVKATRSDKVVVWIDPWGQIMDMPPAREEAPSER